MANNSRQRNLFMRNNTLHRTHKVRHVKYGELLHVKSLNFLLNSVSVIQSISSFFKPVLNDAIARSILAFYNSVDYWSKLNKLRDLKVLPFCSIIEQNFRYWLNLEWLDSPLMWLQLTTKNIAPRISGLETIRNIANNWTC